MCLYPGSGGFYCFGCHAHGDAIALYGKALNLTNLEAARQVCRDFGFQYDEGKRRKRAPSPRSDRRREAHYGPTRADARALAKRLDGMREKQADGLLERMRSAQEIIMQMASSKADWDAVLDDMQWRRALQEQSIAQDQLAMLDGMTLAEFYEHVREGGPLRAGEKGGKK